MPMCTLRTLAKAGAESPMATPVLHGDGESVFMRPLQHNIMHGVSHSKSFSAACADGRCVTLKASNIEASAFEAC
jgi:hypothetical protein